MVSTNRLSFVGAVLALAQLATGSAFVTGSSAISHRFASLNTHRFASLNTHRFPQNREPCTNADTKKTKQKLLCCKMALPTADIAPHMDFIQKVAANRVHPRQQQLELLARILQLRGHTVVDPSDRLALHPFMIPVTKDSTTGEVTGLLYDVNTDISAAPALVRTSGKGLLLVSPTIDFAVKRLAFEEDFKQSPEAAEILRLASSNGLLIETGAAKESKLGLERYLLVNAGPTPDLYGWLVEDWLSKMKTEEALITCARASRQAVLQDWGATHYMHSETLRKVAALLKDDRSLECRDCARAALQLPLWSVGTEMTAVVDAAESNMAQMLTSYSKWSQTGGPEEDFVNTGDNDVQRSLGRARYLLDSVLLNDDISYASTRQELAQHLEGAQRLDMATLVRGS